MRIKSVTLYSLPYVLGVASFMVATHQVVPSLTTLRALSDTGTKNAIISGQVVNRSLKSDRLQIMQAVPRADDERQIKFPGQIAPNRTIKNDCNKLPIDVIGRCFADTGPLRHDLLMSPDQHLIGFRRDSREAYVLRLKSTTRSGHG